MSDPDKRAAFYAYRHCIITAIHELCKALKRCTPCADCKRRDLDYTMEFDHVTGTRQRPSPAAARSWLEFQREFNLCEIVCARCHRIRTWERRNAAKADQEH